MFFIGVLIADNSEPNEAEDRAMQHALQSHRLLNATKAATLQSVANLWRPGFFRGKICTYHVR